MTHLKNSKKVRVAGAGTAGGMTKGRPQGRQEPHYTEKVVCIRHLIFVPGAASCFGKGLWTSCEGVPVGDAGFQGMYLAQ